ncbi:MAG: hypothetical protein H0U49_09465 [Parachlamydiaceae bacterium]|nr:hypothetical protein [Parachlamydiaceae bacterium]
MDSPDLYDDEEYAMSDSIDNAIIMHRDAHFGGSFDVMIDYYEKEGKGVCPEFELSRIRELALTEAKTNNNIAGILLSGPEAERVKKAKDAYKSLRDLYDKPLKSKNFLRLIADLILSEEEDPKNEIDAIVAEKGLIVPFLIDVLRSDDYHSTLFPGYGCAPVLAARCLGLIGDKRAMISLFEAIGESDFFDEDDLLLALKSIGEPAKKFLLKVLHARPLNFDNERAAIALVSFSDDPEVTEACFQMLLNKDVWKDVQLTTHLILACEGLKDEELRKKFTDLSEDPAFPKLLLQDIKLITKTWK